MRLLPISWPLLLAALTLAGLTAGGLYLWDLRRRRRVRRARDSAAGPGPGHIALLPTSSGPSATGRQPLLFIIAIGTLGIARLLATLRLLAMNGIDHVVGGALVVEHDIALREQFEREIPVPFRDGRIIFGDDPDYNGFANKPVDWTLDHIDEWGAEIQRAAREAIDAYLRRSGNRAPALIITFLSLGGQAPTAIPVHAEIAARFGRGETTLQIAATALPRHTRLRERWLQLKPALERFGVAGWLLVDNLAPDVTTADNALVMLLVGQLTAAATADAPTAVNNMLALACTKQPGAVLVFQTATASLPAFAFQPDRARPAVYYVQHRPLLVQVHRVLRHLAAGHGTWSATLPVPERGTATFDLVILPVIPAALRQVHDDVLAGFDLRHRLGATNGRQAPDAAAMGANRELAFASLARQIDAARPVCPVIGIRLQAVREGARLISEIVKAPSQRRLSVASRHLRSAKPALTEYVPVEEEAP